MKNRRSFANGCFLDNMARNEFLNSKARVVFTPQEIHCHHDAGFSQPREDYGIPWDANFHSPPTSDIARHKQKIPAYCSNIPTPATPPLEKGASSAFLAKSP